MELSVMRHDVVRLAAALCGAAALVLGFPADAQIYRITNLGSVVPGWSFVGINNGSQLIGNYTVPGNTAQEIHGFIYNNSDGTFTDMGTLGGLQSNATAINNLGQVTGSALIGGPQAISHAFLYSNGVMTDIGTLTGSAYSVGYAINDSGEVAGAFSVGPENSFQPAYYLTAFTYSNGVITNLTPNFSPTGANYNLGFGINNSGQVAGEAGAYGGTFPFLFSGGVLTDLTPNSPNGGDNVGAGIAYAINNIGDVVGSMIVPTETPGIRAFVYSNGTLTDLTPPGDSCCNYDAAYAINDAGQVLATLNSIPVLYQDGISTPISSLLDPTDPLAPTTVIQKGVAINASGWILAYGYSTITNADSSYLLTPQTLSVTPAPLSFGNQAVGTTSASQLVTVKNNATTTIAITSVTATGDFKASNNCGVSLTPGASCTIGVTFSPTQVDTRSGTVVITADVIYSVPLSGTGTILVNLTSSVPTVTVGLPVTLTWTSVTQAGAFCNASGGASGDGWSGQLAANGTMAVTEASSGKFTYILTCGAGSQNAVGQVVVTDTVPSVSLTANPTNLTVGQPTTLTWVATNANSCTATGNGSGDGWSGTKPTSGTASITESTVGLITYTITCASGPQSANASVQVFNNAKSSSGGGGGQLNLLSLVFLLIVFLLRRTTVELT
jgi:probable HAF family extracellular repeat protein